MVSRSLYGSRPTRSDALDWAVCFISIMALAGITKLGSAGAALFIAPWGIVVLRRPQLAIETVIRNGWFLLLPIYALASIIWSDYPIDTLKHGVEFLLTIFIAIWASTLIKPRIFISALFFAGLLVIVLSVAGGEQGVDERTGEYVLVGIFASKNQLALYASVLIFTCFTLAIDSSLSRRMRLLALATILPALWSLIVSRSTGSILFGTAAVAAVLVLMLISKVPSAMRAALFLILFMIAIAVLAAVALAVQDLGGVLDLLGKDSSLTGRTDLWEAAIALIEKRPLLGVGFNAFWHVGSPEPERLWFISNVPSGAGFNFHNLYLNTWVELGLIGLVGLIALFIGLALRLVFVVVLNPKPHHFFAAGIFIYFLMLSPLEAYFLYEFHLAAFLLGVCWCFLNPRSVARSRARHFQRIPAYN